MLQRYLQAWGQKLASTARNRAVTLWYVDCFAGPWRSKDQLRDDTSAAIGVLALDEAMSFWREKGARVDAQAIFAVVHSYFGPGQSSQLRLIRGQLTAHP